MSNVLKQFTPNHVAHELGENGCCPNPRALEMEMMHQVWAAGLHDKVRYRAFGCSGVCVELRCKPLFRRKHLSAWHGAVTMERAFSMAAEDWNRRADND